MVKKAVIYLVLFVLAFATRLPFLDHNYDYSFEADSEGNVDYTRSLYFFFKNPSQNKPHELSGYPTYLDGNFVMVAIGANMLRPLIKSGLIDVQVRDSDNSIIIFTHRWLALLFSSLTTVLLLSSLIALDATIPIGLMIVSLIYLFNHQHLEIDYMRVDHYLVFSFVFAFRTCLSVLKNPSSRWRWIGLGVASAMLLATKLNSPLYLLMVLTTGVLVIREHFSIIRTLYPFFLGFVPVSLLLWINWLLFPENAIGTIQEILEVAERFIGYWSVKPYFYYHFQQFVVEGQQFQVTLLILAVCLGLYVLLSSIKQKPRKSLVVLLSLFIVHSVYAIFTSKTARYGVFFPIYYSLVIGTAYGILRSDTRLSKKVISLLICLMIIPQGIANIRNYGKLKKQADAREVSIEITRLKPRRWIQNNVSPGARISYTHPKFTNPPIFDLPYKFSDAILTYPYWENEGILDFLPPEFEDVKDAADVFVVVDNYKQLHLNELRSYSKNDSTTLFAWNAFYRNLETLEHKIFTAKTPNYGIHKVGIYVIRKSEFTNTPAINNLSIRLSQKRHLNASWTETSQFPAHDNIELQVSKDSTFSWLVSNVFDGWLSKYNRHLISDNLTDQESTIIPRKLLTSQVQLTIDGEPFDWNRDKKEVLIFFTSVFNKMQRDSLSFEESIKKIPMPETDAILTHIYSVYGYVGNLRFRDLESVFGIKTSDIKPYMHNQKFKLHLEENEHSYYVRIRFKNPEWVQSPWSNTVKIN